LRRPTTANRIRNAFSGLWWRQARQKGNGQLKVGHRQFYRGCGGAQPDPEAITYQV